MNPVQSCLLDFEAASHGLNHLTSNRFQLLNNIQTGLPRNNSNIFLNPMMVRDQDVRPLSGRLTSDAINEFLRYIPLVPRSRL